MSLSLRFLWLLLTLGTLIAVYITGVRDWAGWAVMYASFVIVAADPRLRSDRATLVAVFLVLAAHHAASLVNVFFWTLPGAEYDAYTFHRYGIEQAEVHKLWSELFKLRIGSEFYERILAYAYFGLGDSLLLGQGLTVLFFALTCLVFVRLVDLLNGQRFAPFLVLLFGGLPSAIILGSLTLREGYELFFFMLGVYAGMRVFDHSTRWALPVCVVSMLMMGMFHQLLMIYALFSVILLMVVPLLGGAVSRNKMKLAIAGVSGMVIAGVLTMSVIKTGASNNYLRMASGGVTDALVEYRRLIATGNPRTSFGVELSNDSVADFVGSATLVYGYYLAAPFPWHIEEASDLYAAAESLLRILLIAAMIVGLVNAKDRQRRALITLGLMYLSMTALWAMGTTNYGQAIRHHILSNWILVAAGGPILLNWLRKRLPGLDADRRPDD